MAGRCPTQHPYTAVSSLVQAGGSPLVRTGAHVEGVRTNAEGSSDPDQGEESTGLRDAQQSVHLVAATVGFVSLGTLWASVIWGITLKSGWALTRIRHATIYGVHQTLTVFGLCLGLVHALAQLAVPQGPVRVVDEWLPFANPGDPIGIGFGVIALELFIALAFSILIQRRLGYHRWRSLHRAAYLAFTLLCGHVLISGSDVGAASVTGAIVAAWASTVLLRLVTLPAVARLPRAMQERIADRLRGRQVVVNVDPGRCARFGFCEHEAPGVFQLHGDGRLSYRSSVPGDDVEAVVQAARACPARAIALSRLPTKVVIASTEQQTGHSPQFTYLINNSGEGGEGTTGYAPRSRHGTGR